MRNNPEIGLQLLNRALQMFVIYCLQETLVLQGNFFKKNCNVANGLHKKPQYHFLQCGYSKHQMFWNLRMKNHTRKVTLSNAALHTNKLCLLFSKTRWTNWFSEKMTLRNRPVSEPITFTSHHSSISCGCYQSYITVKEIHDMETPTCEPSFVRSKVYTCTAYTKSIIHLYSMTVYRKSKLTSNLDNTTLQMKHLMMVFLICIAMNAFIIANL